MDLRCSFITSYDACYFAGELNPDYQSPLSGELITGDALPAAEGNCSTEVQATVIIEIFGGFNFGHFRISPEFLISGGI